MDGNLKDALAGSWGTNSSRLRDLMSNTATVDLREKAVREHENRDWMETTDRCMPHNVY
jgi:hypothetical protein